METKGFRYEFTIKELWCFLFKKKICPHCGGKLEKSKCVETVDGKIFDTASLPLYIKGRKINHYFYSFNCATCQENYTLKDLAK